MHAETESLTRRPSQLGKWSSPEVRASFIRKLYAVLFVQLVLAVMIGVLLQTLCMDWLRSHNLLSLLTLVPTLLGIACLCFCHNLLRPFPVTWIILVVFAGNFGALGGFVPWQSGILPAGVACATLIALIIYVSVANREFEAFGPYLLTLTVMLFGFGLSITVLLCVPGAQIEWLPMVCGFLAVFLLMCCIICDTQMILGEWGGHRIQFSTGEYAFAAVVVPLRTLHVLVRVLRLLGERN